jgi:hypothetical protein
VALGFAHALGARQAGCFVVKSETEALQLALSMRPKDGEPAGTLPERLAAALKSDGITAPSGKQAPALTSG